VSRVLERVRIPTHGLERGRAEEGSEGYRGEGRRAGVRRVLEW